MKGISRTLGEDFEIAKMNLSSRPRLLAFIKLSKSNEINLSGKIIDEIKSHKVEVNSIGLNFNENYIIPSFSKEKISNQEDSEKLQIYSCIN